MDPNTEKTSNLNSSSFSPKGQSVKHEDASSLDALYEKREWALFSSMCLTLFTLGWNDGTVGPLLPRMQASYDLSYTLVSMIFIGSTIGFLIGALLNIYLNKRFGSGIVLVLGASISVVAFAIEAIAPPFPLFVFAWGLNGVGLSLQDAQANAIVATLQRKAALKMGLFQAVYGTGALIAPLVATQFAELPRWSFHFLIGGGLAFINALLLAKTTRFRRMDDLLATVGIKPVEADGNEPNAEKPNAYKTILSIPAVHLLTALLFIYVGLAVTLGGWIVTYLQQQRGGDASAGYASAGLFGGLALGRVILIWPTLLLGPKVSMLVYCGLCIGLQFVVWFVPSLIGSTIAESFVGFFLAPMYPMAMQLCGVLLPREFLAGAIGWIAGLGGTSGSAVFPFITGAIANVKGIDVLQPIAVAMICSLVVLWAFIPTQKSKKTSDVEVREPRPREATLT